MTGDGAIAMLMARFSSGKIDDNDKEIAQSFAGENKFDTDKYLEDVK